MSARDDYPTLADLEAGVWALPRRMRMAIAVALDDIDLLRSSIQLCRKGMHYPECDGMMVCVCSENDRHRDVTT